MTKSLRHDRRFWIFLNVIAFLAAASTTGYAIPDDGCDTGCRNIAYCNAGECTGGEWIPEEWVCRCYKDFRPEELGVKKKKLVPAAPKTKIIAKKMVQ